MKKSVLISVYNLEIGGIERSLINMLEAFDFETYEVELLIFDHSGEFMKMIPDQVRVLPPNPKLSNFRRPIKQCLQEGYILTSIIRLLCKGVVWWKARFQGLIESGYAQEQLAIHYTSYVLPRIPKHYDVAISYAWPHDYIAQKVTADVKLAWIHTDYSKLNINRSLDLAVWQQFDYIASISEACSEAFLAVYPTLAARLIPIPNITAPLYIHRMAAKRDEAEAAVSMSREHFNLLSVGRLSPVKGFDLAIEALHLAHDRGYTHFKWFVIGYGGEEQRLRELIATYGLEHSFILLGKKTNPYPYMKTCDVYVQPSRYEGMAVTVTEAKILGKPVLLTNYDTSRSQVMDGIDGMICEMSAEGIANAIIRLFEQDELRERLAMYVKQQEYGNPEQLEQLYQCVAGSELRSRGVG